MRLRRSVAVGSGIAAVGVAIFAMGSAPRWAQAIVAVLVAIAAIAELPSRRVPGRIPPLLVILGIAAGLTILQLLPVGHGVVEALNPTGAALRADGARIAGITPSETLTFDVPGSLSALAFFLTLLGVAAVSLRFSISERGRFGVLATVAVACGLAAVVAGVHALFGTSMLYGVYQPMHASPRVLGPLLNDNQLGCLTALGAVVAGSLVVRHGQPVWARISWITCACACAIACLSTLSRGAAIALGAGIIVLGASLLGQRFTNGPGRGTRRGFATGSLPIAVVAICAVVVVVYASSEGVTQQLQHTSLTELSDPHSKFAAWRSAAQLIEESPWSGWGRGAFESAFTRVHATSGIATFSYLENEYLQTVVDWGIAGACLLALAGGWLAFAALRRWRGGPLSAGALAGLTVVALQSNVDFGVELLGLAVPITMVAATLTYVPLREPGRRTLRLVRALRAVHVLAILAGAAVLLSSATISVTEDHDAVVDPTQLTLDQLRDPIARHPLDYRQYLLEAIVLARDHDDRAIHVLNHALRLHPTHSGLHLFAAEILRNSGHPDQAAVEYEAALRSSTDPRRLISMIVERLGDARSIAQAIPPDDPRFDAILHIFDDLHRPDVSAEWLERVLATHRDERTCAALYTLATRTGDVSQLGSAASMCPHYQPTRQVKLGLAKLAYEHHDDASTVHLVADVETWTGDVQQKLDAWLLLCDAKQDLGELDEAERCLHRLDATGYVTSREVIDKRIERIQHARILRDTEPAPANPPPIVQLITRLFAGLVTGLF